MPITTTRTRELVGKTITSVIRERDPETGRLYLKRIKLSDGSVLFAHGWENDNGTHGEFCRVKPAKKPRNGA